MLVMPPTPGRARRTSRRAASSLPAFLLGQGDQLRVSARDRRRPLRAGAFREGATPEDRLVAQFVFVARAELPAGRERDDRLAGRDAHEEGARLAGVVADVGEGG